MELSSASSVTISLYLKAKQPLPTRKTFPMSKIWLNGKITGKELRLLHPLEYQKMLEERWKIRNAPNGAASRID